MSIREHLHAAARETLAECIQQKEALVQAGRAVEPTRKSRNYVGTELCALRAMTCLDLEKGTIVGYSVFDSMEVDGRRFSVSIQVNALPTKSGEWPPEGV